MSNATQTVTTGIFAAVSVLCLMVTYWMALGVREDLLASRRERKRAEELLAAAERQSQDG